MGRGVIVALLVAIPLNYLLAVVFPDYDAPTSFEWWGFWLPLVIGALLCGLIWPRREVVSWRDSVFAAILITLGYVVFPLSIAVMATSLLQPVFYRLGEYAQGSWISSFGPLPVIVICLLSFLTSLAGLRLGLWLRRSDSVT